MYRNTEPKIRAFGQSRRGEEMGCHTDARLRQFTWKFILELLLFDRGSNRHASLVEHLQMLKCFWEKFVEYSECSELFLLLYV